MVKAGDRVGPYWLVQRLGEGSFGEVWLAENPTSLIFDQKRVAVKISKNNIPFADIEREANNWKKMGHHPNILPLLDARLCRFNGHDLGVLVSPYVSEGTLSDWMKSKMNWDFSSDILFIMEGILAGLEHMHQMGTNGIIHRDLKPSNIALVQNVPKLMDFGLACVQEATIEQSAVTGTYAYMAPEMFDGFRSRQGDVWAVGVIFYQLVTGKLPFRAHEPAQLMRKILQEPPPPLPATLPDGIRDIILQALSKNPGARFPSAKEMRQALRQVSEGTAASEAPTIVRPSAPLSEQGRPVRRRSAVLILGLALAILGGIGAIWQFETHRLPVKEPALAANKHYQAAERLIQEGKWDAALAEARKVTEAVPEFQPGYKLRGASQLARKEFEAAAQSYQKACQLRPADTEARLGLATAMEALGEKKEAIRLYRSITQDPKSVMIEKDQAVYRLNELK